MSNIKASVIAFIKQHQIVKHLAAVLFLLSLGLLIWWAMSMKSFELHQNISLFKSTSTQVTNNALTAHISKPVSLQIPSINMQADFEGALGLDEYGAVLVPESYDTVGWYKYGPLPGSLGPSVVLGHVDSREGPAVFFYLGQVAQGDEVFIEREDGSVLTYTITELERVEQNTFPTEKVYGSIPYAGLRLITCSGTYDRGEKRYSHNLIVYAELKHVE